MQSATVRDDDGLVASPGPYDARAAIGHARKAEMRGVEALHIVARPSDVEEMALAIRETR